MYEADSILLDEEKKSNDGATASKATKEKVREAQEQRWRWLGIRDDRETFTWLEVKEPKPSSRWIIVEDADLEPFSELDKESKKKKLEDSSSWMQKHESMG